MNVFLSANPKLEFDEGYLKPPNFIKFCDTIQVPPKKLYDKYYRCVLSKNYSKILLNHRLSLILNQKEFAKLSSLSPVTIGLIENNKKYPSRSQFTKIIEVIKQTN